MERTTESPELKGTHKGHQAKLLALHRKPQEAHRKKVVGVLLALSSTHRSGLVAGFGRRKLQENRRQLCGCLQELLPCSGAVDKGEHEAACWKPNKWEMKADGMG